MATAAWCYSNSTNSANNGNSADRANSVKVVSHQARIFVSEIIKTDHVGSYEFLHTPAEHLCRGKIF